MAPEAENERMLKIIEKLIDKGEDATPLEVFQHLMESRETKQSHLWEILGSKGIASEVLNGKRGISKTHARALAHYFHVSADLFT